MLSEFNYFEPVTVQAQIEEEYDEAVEPTAAVGGSSISFEIKGVPSVYRDLSNSYLEVQFKVTTSTGADLPADTAVAPVNHMLHSMFSGVDIDVCGSRKFSSDGNYAYRAMIEALLTYSDDVLKTRALLSGWVQDKDAALMDSLLLVDADNARHNPAFKERARRVARSRLVTLVGRPHADLFHQDKDIPPDCPVKIHFTLASPEFFLMGAADSRFKFQVVKALLHVRSKKVSTDLVLAHREMLKVSNIRLPHTGVTVRKFNIAAGVREHTIVDLFKTKMPKRIVVGLVGHTRSGGDYTLNPYKFENFGLTDIAVKMGGAHIPREPLKMDYATEDYSRAYLSTLAALGLDSGNDALAIPPTLWATGCNLYAFKLTPGPIDSHAESAKHTETVTLKLEFAQALEAAVDVIVYSETNMLLEINQLNAATLA